MASPPKRLSAPTITDRRPAVATAMPVDIGETERTV
jgi:hypothetical protein